MKFTDIPQMTRSARYQAQIPWTEVEAKLARYNDQGQLQLNPEFQRAHVWDDEKRRRYVEYILRGGRSGRDIYFNQADWMRDFKAPMYLVDGKQRLEAVRRFLNNELAIFDGVYYKDFEGGTPYEAEFNFHINDLKTYREVCQWYIDLNDGGVAHTPEEIQKVKDILNALDK